jgi:hypothetical protein
MEQLHPTDDNTITEAARAAVAVEFACAPSELRVVGVSGGYSRNRRALVEYAGQWLFAKEVDKVLLPGDGEEELRWLQKDYQCVKAIREKVPELVPEWSRLAADNHLLLLPSYREADGWMWTLPTDPDHQRAYIQSVVDATKRLQGVSFDTEQNKDLQLQPFLRDELALDGGFELIITNEVIRNQLQDKFAGLAQDVTLTHLHPAIEKMQQLLASDERLKLLAARGRQLTSQPNDCFGHCDVRSDNLAYNLETGEVKLVDWNWASYTPTKFGSTEFLIDMAKRGVDISPWMEECNPELLAASVGFFARRCLKDPLTPGSTLRDMQAKSAAIALSLYERVMAAEV